MKCSGKLRGCTAFGTALSRLLGIEFREGVPQIWFPGNCNHIAIQLGTDALNDVNKALFQLAHECVHLLDPVIFEQASVLEEGLATNFSLIYVRRSNPSYETGSAKYDAANRRVGQLLTQYLMQSVIFEKKGTDCQDLLRKS